MNIAYERLTQALADGFCLHGSKHAYSVIEPRQAYCDSDLEENTQHGVYAAPDDVRVPVFMALFARKHSDRGNSSSYSHHGKGPLVIKGKNTTFSPGCVHVLPRRTFTWYGEQYISRVAVVPSFLIQVDPSIIRLFANIELHIPIPPPY